MLPAMSTRLAPIAASAISALALAAACSSDPVSTPTPAGDGGGTVPADATTPLAFGCGPGKRYTVVIPPEGCSLDSSQPGSSPTDPWGTGRVLDNTTGLTWMAKSYFRAGGLNLIQEAADYCAGRGMRLPTKDEALGIAGPNRATCAFPCNWSTWTSSSAGPGLSWYIDGDGGGAGTYGDYGKIYGVLCVK